MCVLRGQFTAQFKELNRWPYHTQWHEHTKIFTKRQYTRSVCHYMSFRGRGGVEADSGDLGGQADLFYRTVCCYEERHSF